MRYAVRWGKHFRGWEIAEDGSVSSWPAGHPTRPVSRSETADRAEAENVRATLGPTARIVRILTHEEAKRKAAAEELWEMAAEIEREANEEWTVVKLRARARELAPWVRWPPPVRER